MLRRITRRSQFAFRGTGPGRVLRVGAINFGTAIGIGWGDGNDVFGFWGSLRNEPSGMRSEQLGSPIQIWVSVSESFYRL
jgi:hypothetical protein